LHATTWRSHKEQKRFEDALAAFSKAAELDPLYPRNVGDMFRQRKQFDEAKRWLRTALDVDPTSATRTTTCRSSTRICSQRPNPLISRAAQCFTMRT
jgi:tetratricopeptide (TPR) repeat protein